MEEYVVTIHVKAKSRETIDDWLAAYLMGDDWFGIGDFTWVVDDLEGEGYLD